MSINELLARGFNPGAGAVAGAQNAYAMKRDQMGDAERAENRNYIRGRDERNFLAQQGQRQQQLTQKQVEFSQYVTETLSKLPEEQRGAAYAQLQAEGNKMFPDNPDDTPFEQIAPMLKPFVDPRAAAREDADYANELAMKRDAAKEAAKANNRAPNPTVTLSPAEKAVDQNFAKDYNEFVAQGGMADIEKQLKQLEEVKTYLEDPTTFAATGGFVGLTPKWARDIIPGLEQGAAAQDAVEEVVQRNLRLVLGAQFTEKEGARLIERAYNPRQSEEQNAMRVGRLVDQIRGAAEAKMAAAQYYEENGTLKGFKGKTQFSIDDFLGDSSASGTIQRDSNGKVTGSTSSASDGWGIVGASN